MMKSILTLCFLFLTLSVFAQPANDECSGAINLPLGTPPPCPSTTPVVNTFNYSNINATPTVPYPTFNNCAIGGQTNAPADEVWFRFVPNSNVLTIAVSGQLANPNIVVFSGSNCAFLTAVECARGNASPLTLMLNVVPGQQYYLLISGGFVGDQGNFTLTMTSSRDCSPCLQAANFVASPPPLNGTYNSGQVINFCFTISNWDVTSTIEWLHAIQIDFGPGWDINSLGPIPPPSCGGDGAWGWYDSWVGCNTGQTFGPGFAYDSSSGLGCGGTPNDGNPGNNWGDGNNGCANIGGSGPPAVTFCWTIRVSDCPPNVTGNDLSVIVEVLSDGDSGSWNQTGCNSGSTYNFLASAVCCNDGNPLVFATPTRCAQTNDGSITAEGSTPGESYNIFVFNSSGQLIGESLGVIGPATFNNLPAGQYSVLAVNALSGCQRSRNTLIGPGPPPVAIPSNAGPYCPGEPISLTGNYSFGFPATNVTYQWTGPGGFSSNQQNPANATMGGNYSLVVTVDGCVSAPAITNVVIQAATANVSASPTLVCPNAPSTLTATGAQSYAWSTGQTGSSITVNPVDPTVYTVTATNAFGCTVTNTVFVDVHPVPNLQVFGPDFGCEGDVGVLSTFGGPFTQYLWSDGQTGSSIAANLVSPQADFSVTATTANGCTVTADISFIVFPAPVGVASASPATICAGQPATLTASGGASYQWSNNATGASISVSPNATTSYIVTVTGVDGCLDTASVTVNVVQPLAAPVITCSDITPNSVTFSWPPVPGTTGYTVNVLSGQSGTLAGTTYTVGGLAPGTDVTIEVAANTGTVCPPAVSTFSCAAISCPPIDIDLNDPGAFCFNAGNSTDTLQATVSGGSGTGDGIWSGPGILDSIIGIFHPDTAGIGNHPIVYSYTEGVCTYTDTLFIDVFAIPDADFSVAPDTICLTDSITVVYIGAASAGAAYTWNFDGGTADPGTGQGPHTVNWATAGTKTITLTVEENGCTSTEFSQTVQVDAPLDAPVITCGPATTTSVSFSWPAVPGATAYVVNVLSGQNGTLSGTTYTVTGLLPEEVVEIEVTTEGNTACGPVSITATCSAAACPTFTLSIAPVADICLTANTPVQTLQATVTGGSGGTGTWSGPGITDATNGTFDSDAAGPGQHIITYEYAEGPCSALTTITINVFETPVASFSVAPSLLCTGQNATVTFNGSAGNGATYAWNFGGGAANPGTGQGSHAVSWATPGTKTISLTVTENGCVSSVLTQTLNVVAPLASPVISCATSTDEIVFSWADVPGASGYQVNVLSGPAGVQSGNTYTVSGLTPGDAVQIQVVALNAGPCGPSSAEQTCVAQACPTVTMVIDPVAPVCLTATAPAITLDADISGGAGGGTETWSGPGITGGMGVFDPNLAGVGAHTVSLTYQEGTCIYTASITITVHAVPGADFSASGPICLNDASTLTYTGTATAGALYIWNFDGGTANPGTGQGPHTVSWATAGLKTITLTVEENGCTSAQFSQTVQVDAPLTAPTIVCSQPTTTSVTFTWPDVSGATGYTVNVITGQSGTLSGTTYTVTGLQPEDVVEIEVTATGNTVCGPVSATASCNAAACPVFNLSIAPVADICLTANTAAFNLQATVTGGSGGTGSWSGPGITDAGAGTFNPVTAGPGMHTITYNYTEGPCNASATITINVFATPVADFGAAPSPLCIGQDATVTFNGSAGNTAVYNWNFDGGTANPGTGQGPHTASWATAGNKIVSLTVTENGCTSNLFTQSMTVEAPLAAPVINCATSTDEIVFSWADVPGASGYDVTVLAGPAGVQSGNTYTVSGLTPGDAVQIRVTALNAGPCGPSSTEQTCVAQACPAVNIILSAVEPICLTANAPAVTLTADVTGGAGGGTSIWSGPGIVNGGAGEFSPSVAGPGTHTINYNYQEGTCTYNSSMTITVIAQPIATFTAPGPVCVDAPITVSFTGTAPTGAAFNWNFDGGTATPGTGQGPHTVTWASAGSKTISLMVGDGNCNSEPFTQTVQVDAPLPAPQITCSSTSTSITFSWMPVPGAASYQVTDIDGPAGVLSGTTYTVSGLTPNQSVSISVTAVGTGACGNSTATTTCIAQNCPGLVLIIGGTQLICSGEPAQATFTFTATATGPFTVVYSINGGAPITGTFTNGQSIPVAATQTTTITASSITDNSLPDCTYPTAASWTIFVTQPVSAGTPAAPARLCAGENTTVSLASLLSGASPNGVWMESSASPSTGGAFNAVAGTFSAAGQQAGLYTFVYAVPGPNPCPGSQATVSVILEPSPVADAGPDQTLTCNMGMVSLGGPNTSTGPGITYLWSSPTPGVVISNPATQIIEAAQQGTFLLRVTNDIGCSGTDEVIVTASFEAPVAEVIVTPISCFNAANGSILITGVTGGRAPYEFSLNGGAFGGQQLFAGLDARQHTLTVRDQNGCFSELTFTLDNPQQLTVLLQTNISQNRIEWGDSVRLEAIFTPGVVLDTIIWRPDSISQPTSSIVVRPTSATTYSVQIVDKNGCTAEDQVTIFVERIRRIFIPNSFSPNDDGVNDMLTIFADPAQVREVKTFMVFNRWGETMYELQNFSPNDLGIGWNGKHREQLMNAGVYVYVAEIEFNDGEVVIYKGDVTLMR
ncbi:MAG: gliding motility-associated C-terminal domain-containing protein [Saprospiraceae bacterium]|nr:gliding motility-associated C-terminal domain-containing protein [Saprospiraceae bacterium]